jgi:hypothetical protein
MHVVSSTDSATWWCLISGYRLEHTLPRGQTTPSTPADPPVLTPELLSTYTPIIAPSLALTL